jgi:hypothetical protein
MPIIRFQPLLASAQEIVSSTRIWVRASASPGCGEPVEAFAREGLCHVRMQPPLRIGKVGMRPDEGHQALGAFDGFAWFHG